MKTGFLINQYRQDRHGDAAADGHQAGSVSRKHTGHRDTRVDLMAVDQAGAEHDDHRFTRHILAQMPHIVGPQRFQQTDILLQCLQDPMPKKALGQQCQR